MYAYLFRKFVNLFTAEQEKVKMIKQIQIILIATLITGCSHVREYSNYEELNTIAQEKPVILKLADGTFTKGKNLMVTTDSTYWENYYPIKNRVVPTAQINEVIIVKLGRGAWEGFQTVAISSLSVGLLGLLSGGDSRNSNLRFSGTFYFYILTALGTFYGSMVGIPLGFLIGSRDVYLVNTEPPTPQREEDDEPKN